MSCYFRTLSATLTSLMRTGPSWFNPSTGESLTHRLCKTRRILKSRGTLDRIFLHAERIRSMRISEHKIISILVWFNLNVYIFSTHTHTHTKYSILIFVSFHLTQKISLANLFEKFNIEHSRTQANKLQRCKQIILICQIIV